MLVMCTWGLKMAVLWLNMLASFVNLVNIHQGPVYMVLFNDLVKFMTLCWPAE